MEYKGGKPQVPRVGGEKTTPQSNDDRTGSQADRKLLNTIVQANNTIYGDDLVIVNEDKNSLKFISSYLDSIGPEPLSPNDFGDMFKIDKSPDATAQGIFNACSYSAFSQMPELIPDQEKRFDFDSESSSKFEYELYIDYKINCELFGVEPQDYLTWRFDNDLRTGLSYGRTNEKEVDVIEVSEPIIYREWKTDDQGFNAMVVPQGDSEVVSNFKKEVKKSNVRNKYKFNVVKYSRQKNASRKVFCEEVDRFCNEFVVGEPNKRLSPAFKAQNDTVHLEHEFESTIYCRAVTFLRVPKTFPQELVRIQKLSPHLVTGDFDLMTLKEAFRSVNEVLYELCWFVKAEIVSYKISNKYLFHFFHNGRQLTHLHAKRVTENFRDSDAMTYWLRNYSLFLQIFCGRKTNQFTKRIIEYMNDQGTMYQISKGVSLCSKTPNVKAKFNRGPARQFNDDRDRGVHGVRNKYIEYRDPDYERQMFSPFAESFSPSSIFSGARNKLVDSVGSFLTDSVSDAVSKIPERIGSYVGSALQKGADLFVSIKDYLVKEFENLKSIVIKLFESISQETKIFACISFFCIFLLLLFMYIFRSMFSKCKKVFSLCLCSTLEYLGCNLSKKDIVHIQEVFENEYERQSLSDLAPVLGLALGAALSATSKADSQTAGAVINFASRFPTVFSSVEECVCSSFDYIYHWYYGEHYLKDKKIMDDFDNFIEKFRVFCETPDVELAIDRDLVVASKLEELHSTAKILEPLTHHIRTNPTFSMVLGKAFAKLNSLYESHRKTADLYCTRIETVCCWLFGDTGQGKTTIYPHIIAGVYDLVRESMPELLPYKYSPSHCHSRNKLSQYWEGYERQFACVWNEALEKQDPQERQRTLSELLTACESGTFPLDMAFGDKGKAFFNSMLAVVTSNFTDNLLNKESHMTFPSAIVRRRTLYLQVIRDERFVMKKDGSQANFDEGWKFIVSEPDIEAFKESFYLGLPKNLHEMVQRDGSIVLRFSHVISILAAEIMQRQEQRQDVSEFMRNFSYTKYVTDARSVPEKYNGPVFQASEADVRKKGVERGIRAQRRADKTEKFQQRVKSTESAFMSEVVSSSVSQTRVSETTTTTTGPVVFTYGDRPWVVVDKKEEPLRPVRPPKIRKALPPIPVDKYERQMYLSKWWGGEKTVGDCVRYAIDPSWQKLELNSQLNFAGYGEGLQDPEMKNIVRFNIDLADQREFHVAGMCVTSPLVLQNFLQKFQYYLTSPDPRIMIKGALMTRILLVRVIFESRLPIGTKDYLIKKMRKYGVKNQVFMTSPQVIYDACKMVRDDPEWSFNLSQFPLVGQLLSILETESYGGFSDNWLSRLAKQIIDYKESRQGSYYFEEDPKRFLRRFGLTEPFTEVDNSIFCGAHWSTYGSILYERWSEYLDSTVGKFMRKHSHLVFGAAASVLAVGIVGLCGWFATKEEDTIKERVGLFGQSGHNLKEEVNSSVSKRGNVTAQSLGRGHQQKLPVRAVQAHSLNRGNQQRLPSRSVHAHSMHRGQSQKLPIRSVQAQTEPIHIEEYVIQSAFSEGAAWVVAGFKYPSLIEAYDDYAVFINRTYEESTAASIMQIVDVWMEYCDSPDFSILDSIIFDDWRDWEGVDIPSRQAVIKFSQASPEQRQTWLKQAKRAGDWDYRLYDIIDSTCYGQSGSLQQVYNFSQHMRTIEVVYPGDRRYRAEGILSGSRFFTIAHFFAEYGFDFVQINIVNAQGVLATAYASQVTVKPLPNKRDVFVVDFPASALSPFKSLKPKMFKNSQDMQEKLAMVGEFSRLSRTVMPDGSILLERVTRNHIQKGVKPIDEIYLHDKFVKVDHSFYYLMLGGMGTPGDCGQPYLWTDPTGVVWFLGIHTGKTNSNSVFSPIFQDDLDERYFRQCYYPSFLQITSPTLSRPVHNKKFLYLGKAPKVKIIPSETKLRASPAQGHHDMEPLYGEPLQVPGYLCETWIGDRETGFLCKPLENALEKLSRAPPRPMPKWMKDLSKNYPDIAFEGFFPREMDLARIRPWTIEEAVFGIPGIWDGLDSSTAVGYDVECAIPKARSRKDLWNPDTREIHPLLRLLVQQIHDAVDRGELPRNVVAGCLKDETRPDPKKPRLFSVGSLSMLLFHVMYLGAIVTEMKRCRATSDVAIGTNVHAFDWKLLFSKILDNLALEIIAGDGESFDTGINPWAAKLFSYAILPFYRLPKKSKVYRYVQAACLSCVGPILVIVSDVYDLAFSNPSGQWPTGIFNSFVNVISFNFFFWYAVQTHKEADPEMENYSRRQAMPLIVYGDDNMAGVIKRFQKICTMPLYAEFVFRFFGYKYTRPDKSEITDNFMKREEVEFLARKFRQEGGNIKAPLSEASIQSMCYWIREPAKDNAEGLTVDSQFLVNLEQAHQEWYHYGKERFDLEADRIKTMCRDLGISYPGKSYRHYSERWLLAQHS